MSSTNKGAGGDFDFCLSVLPEDPCQVHQPPNPNLSCSFCCLLRLDIPAVSPPTPAAKSGFREGGLVGLYHQQWGSRAHDGDDSPVGSGDCRRVQSVMTMVMPRTDPEFGWKNKQAGQ